MKKLRDSINICLAKEQRRKIFISSPKYSLSKGFLQKDIYLGITCFRNLREKLQQDINSSHWNGLACMGMVRRPNVCRKNTNGICHNSTITIFLAHFTLWLWEFRIFQASPCLHLFCRTYVILPIYFFRFQLM